MDNIYSCGFQFFQVSVSLDHINLIIQYITLNLYSIYTNHLGWIKMWLYFCRLRTLTIGTIDSLNTHSRTWMQQLQYILHTVHITYSTYYVQCILTRYLLGITMLFVRVYYMGLCVYSVVYSSYILHRNMYTTCTSCSMFHCVQCWEWWTSRSGL